jgi:hypothetical protein
MDRYELKQKAEEQLKQKQGFQLEEIKYLRSDLLQTRADLQRTIVYTFALATIISTLVTKLTDFADGSYLHFILLTTSILFFMLSLNYIGNMRHYLNVARYLETKCKELTDSFDQRYDNEKTFELLNWEIYNRDFYKKGFSKMILGLTWGVQPLYPTFFGLVSFLIAISKFSFVEMKSNAILLLLTSLPVLLMASSIASMIKALIEINNDIKLANKYSRYTFNLKKSAEITTANKSIAANGSDEKQ